MQSGFSGGLVVDFPNSTRAKKYFLTLMVRTSSIAVMLHMQVFLSKQIPRAIIQLIPYIYKACSYALAFPLRWMGTGVPST